MRRPAVLIRPGSDDPIRAYLVERGLLRPRRRPSPEEAKAQRANAGPSVHKPTVKESNHGISQV